MGIRNLRKQPFLSWHNEDVSNDNNTKHEKGLSP
jgi:hypothetical protein